ncbi:phosphonate ABC transporter, permease protein PhnE [Paenibacillus prosopidis]|uniref:Phosphonate transport system permease protein n=1 Tax=Paenibacillus prosopidis TaxID=630520 RepID=A0A368W6X5_9BACL|nr:phosphonate ABC transporter, permease protein PhnE [Paenibacillus prosopidis]RCW51722.1 phosphonate transport system permease protein [Paenibacillus prosopidis]
MSTNWSETAGKLSNLKQQQDHDEFPRKPRMDSVLLAASLFGIAFFIYCVIRLDFDYYGIYRGTLTFIGSFANMFPPNVSDWKGILSAGLVTLQVAVVGTVLAVVAAFILSFLAAENVSPRTAKAVKGFASFLRAVPTLVWALIFIVAVGLGPFPGILAICVHATGMLIKVFSQSIEEVDEGALEAMRATGAGWLQIMAHGVLPNVFTSFMAWSVFRLEIDIGESVILGAVGAGGIGWEISNAMRAYEFNTVGFVAFVIFLMVFSVELLTNRLKTKIRRRG